MFAINAIGNAIGYINKEEVNLGYNNKEDVSCFLGYLELQLKGGL
jgi:hypothetical protein